MRVESHWTDALSEAPVPIEPGGAAGAREVVRSIAASTGIHVVLLGALLVLSLFFERKPEEPTVPPLQVELRGPQPLPPPQVSQRPTPPAPRRTVPPPVAENRELRMAPSTSGSTTPPSKPRTQAPPFPPDTRPNPDGKPAGGLAGGPLPRPTPGFPTDSNGSPQQQTSPSITGRLRDFRKALDQAPREPGGTKGGGTGSGGFDMPDLPSNGFGVGQFEFESQDYDWTDYYRAIYLPILRAWYSRVYGTAPSFEKWAFQVGSSHLDHQARVRFTIEASGKVVGVAVEDPSGCPPLDDSAADALREVVLPPLPKDFPRRQETVHARFLMEGDTQFIRRSLEPWRSAGFF